MQNIKSAYDPEAFRRQAHQLVDFLADRLDESIAPDSGQKTIQYLAPDAALEMVEQLSADNLFEDVWKNCIRLHNPGFLGHQIMPPVPIAALAGFFSDFVNNGMGVYEMGIAGTALERKVVREVGQRLGMGDQCDGIMTCGGSLANLTAMLAARSHCSPDTDWNDGTTQSLALMVSAQSHYCVDRAARIMGWGENGIIKIPVDDQFRMETDALDAEWEKAKEQGITPVAVVGSACSTSTGSFDNLRSIGEFCERRKMWFHVDGAHGAANGLAEKYRHLLDGIELADSVTIDFHKMLMTPAITSALIFRHGEKSYGSFAQKADYLWEKSDSAEWFNLARRTFECTKTMLSLKVYSIVAAHGWELFDQNVTCLNDLASSFAQKIRQADDFELAIEPQTNIVCYRFLADSGNQNDPNALDELNQSIRRKLLEQGDFYIVQTVLDGKTWLRSTVSNPLTQDSHFDQLLDRIRQIATNVVTSTCR